MASSLAANVPTEKPGSWSSLFHPELIVPEAFDEGQFNVPLQIAAALDIPLCNVIKGLAAWTEHCGWDTVLREYANDSGVSHFSYRGRKLVDRVIRDVHRRALIYNVWDGRIYIYKGAGKFTEHDVKHMTPPQEQGAATSSAAGPVATGANETVATTGDVDVSEYERPKGHLAKGDRHFGTHVDEFTEFPWALAETDMASVPPGRYWIRSTSIYSDYNGRTLRAYSNCSYAVGGSLGLIWLGTQRKTAL